MADMDEDISVEDRIVEAPGNQLPPPVMSKPEKTYKEFEATINRLISAQDRQARLKEDVKTLKNGGYTSGTKPFELKYKSPELDAIPTLDPSGDYDISEDEHIGREYTISIPKGCGYRQMNSIIHMHGIQLQKAIDLEMTKTQVTRLRGEATLDTFLNSATSCEDEHIAAMKSLGIPLLPVLADSRDSISKQAATKMYMDMVHRMAAKRINDNERKSKDETNKKLAMDAVSQRDPDEQVRRMVKQVIGEESNAKSSKRRQGKDRKQGHVIDNVTVFRSMVQNTPALVAGAVTKEQVPTNSSPEKGKGKGKSKSKDKGKSALTTTPKKEKEKARKEKEKAKEKAKIGGLREAMEVKGRPSKNPIPKGKEKASKRPGMVGKAKAKEEAREKARANGRLREACIQCFPTIAARMLYH